MSSRNTSKSTECYYFRYLYDDPSKITGAPLHPGPSRASSVQMTYYMDEDFVNSCAEDTQVLPHLPRLVNLIKKHGYFVSADGQMLYRVQGVKCETIPYDKFHLILGKFAIIGAIKPRTFKKENFIDIRKETDRDRIAGYTEREKYLFVEKPPWASNKIASRIFKHLDVMESLLPVQLVAEDLSPIEYKEGYDYETKTFKQSFPYLKEVLKTHEDLDLREEEKASYYQGGAIEALENLFGYIPTFTQNSADLDALLLFCDWDTFSETS